MDLSTFPALDAGLNATTAVLLVSGYAAIRARRTALHRACMLAAVAVSAAFLACYLWYHAHAGSKHFPGTGAARLLYFAILLSHTVLAAAVVPLVLVTVARGLRDRHPAHERLARWTLPVWLYVSITGVVVYWMLYRVSW
jgi:putative membrane protein